MTRLRFSARASVAALIVGLAGGWAASANAATVDASASGTGATTVSGVTVNGVQELITTAPVAPPLTDAYSEGTITSDVIRNLSPAAAVTVQTMLNTQPSVFAYTNGPLGTGTNVNFRAFNSGQFAETYDGVALNDVFNGGVTNQASVVNNVLLLPSNVDSVQIYRGINNPAVNSYNSLGGTINYLPRRPTDAFGGEIGGSYGSFNTKEFHVGINTGDLGGLKQYLAFSHADSDGWIRNTADRNTNLFYSARYTGLENAEIGLILIYNHNNGYTPFQMPQPLLQQHGGFFQWPLDWSYERDKDSSYLGILTFRVQVATNVVFDSRFFGGYNDYRRVSFDNPVFDQGQTLPDGSIQPYSLGNTGQGFPFWLFYPAGPTYDPTTAFPDAAGDGFAGTDYHFYGYAAYGFGYQPQLTISLPHNTITVGGNITYGSLHSREYWYGAYNMPQTVGFNDAWDEHDSRLFASGYVQDEIKLFGDTLTLTPGVKYLFAHTADTDAIGFFYPYGGTDSDDESFVAPTIGVNYKPTEQLAFYAAFGQNIKFPDITAFYNNIPGNTAATPPPIPPVRVKPEHVSDYEIGARYQSGGFAGSVNFYREDFTNTFIDAFNPVLFQTVVSNGGSSRYQGVEVDLKEDFGAQPWGDLSAYVNFAYNQAEFTSSFVSDYVGGLNSNSGVQVSAGEPLADIPNYLVNAGVVWSWQGWRFDAEGRYVGSQYTDNLNSGTPSTTKVGSYFLVDLGLAKTIPFRGIGPAKAIKFQINVNNLFNRYYFNQAFTQQDFFGNNYLAASPGAPRSVTGSIEVKF